MGESLLSRFPDCGLFLNLPRFYTSSSISGIRDNFIKEKWRIESCQPVPFPSIHSRVGGKLTSRTKHWKGGKAVVQPCWLIPQTCLDQSSPAPAVSPGTTKSIKKTPSRCGPRWTVRYLLRVLWGYGQHLSLVELEKAIVYHSIEAWNITLFQ